MKDYLINYQFELLATITTIVVFIILKFIITKLVRKTGRKNNIVKARSRLVNKYISIILYFLVAGLLTFVWGVNLKEVAVLFSSIFAILGIALFAQWSILSNVTAGVILFFAYPFKIGDTVKILDKDLDSDGPYLIEDIKAYHVTLRKKSGELLVYPNSLMMQKAISLLNEEKKTPKE
ncbi:mechanosensitive ion channel domain-containing protein [uncultured Maribacter sp.]|uniref:mechanosensitive ion channel domain-containing protein n=1 Tax=uncultured Maribacter sp. TaxID=431308 RepID=UPI0026177ACA|nr:mechanosensitive ion channel domain-containing protein [uncultured Maribacter sp.]